MIKTEVTKSVARRPRQAKTTAAMGSGSPQSTYCTGMGSQPEGHRQTPKDAFMSTHAFDILIGYTATTCCDVHDSYEMKDMVHSRVQLLPYIIISLTHNRTYVYDVQTCMQMYSTTVLQKLHAVSHVLNALDM